MEQANIIRARIADVALLREKAAADGELRVAVSAVKKIQARRFAMTYADLLGGGPFQAAARFFLDELYGDTDYAERDAQFSRIAGAVQRLLPEHAVKTAVSLAQLHALSEQLDHAVGKAWSGSAGGDPISRYVNAWRLVGNRAAREAQLNMVLNIGTELIRLTRTPGLRMMLRMMRRPAHAAGLEALQSFLESGFDTFATMEKRKGAAARDFLSLIAARESSIIDILFDSDLIKCRSVLDGV